MEHWLYRLLVCSIFFPEQYSCIPRFHWICIGLGLWSNRRFLGRWQYAVPKVDYPCPADNSHRQRGLIGGLIINVFGFLITVFMVRTDAGEVQESMGCQDLTGFLRSFCRSQFVAHWAFCSYLVLAEIGLVVMEASAVDGCCSAANILRVVHVVVQSLIPFLIALRPLEFRHFGDCT